MAYKCRNCGSIGHNSRTCSSGSWFKEKKPVVKKKKVEEFDLIPYDLDKSDGRVCTFCNRAGHNKTTCGFKKLVRKLLIEILLEKRQEFLNEIVKKNITVGKIYKKVLYSDSQEEKSAYYIVTGFKAFESANISNLVSMLEICKRLYNGYNSYSFREKFVKELKIHMKDANYCSNIVNTVTSMLVQENLHPNLNKRANEDAYWFSRYDTSNRRAYHYYPVNEEQEMSDEQIKQSTLSMLPDSFLTHIEEDLIPSRLQ